MSEPYAPVDAPGTGLPGVARLQSLIDESESGPWPVTDLFVLWHQASGTSVPFDEWCDPSARLLATVLRSPHSQRDADAAVVQFAQARAGADHTAAAVAADLISLVQVLNGCSSNVDEPIDLVARALSVWASERVEAVAAESFTDAVTGLVNCGFLRARLRELHAQCEALAIAPHATFGALVVNLGLLRSPAPERIGAQVAVGRSLRSVFTAGETVAAVGGSRFVAVVPAYALDQAESDLRDRLKGLGDIGVPIHVSRHSFATCAEDTWRSLAGTEMGA